MDVKDHQVITILGESRCYMVPIYQRQYAWDHKLLKQFWEDVVAKSEEAMKGKPKFQHYMGALILAPGTAAIGRTATMQVVDGQQRLTTFQLFIASLRAAEIAEGFTDMAEALQSYIFNVPKPGEKEKDAKFKLSPTPADRDLFRMLMSESWSTIRTTYPQYFYQKGTLVWGKAPKPIRAVAQFREWIDKYVNYGITDAAESIDPVQVPDERDIKEKRLQALQNALLLHLKLVVIQLGEDDDAQVIFETLNSKAEPLLAMDLVRNNIFHRAEAQGESVEDLFEDKWSIFEDESFWKADAPRAKPKRPRIDHFLSHALTAMTGRETSLREVYAEYRDFARPKGNPRFETVGEELDALTRYAPVYRTLEVPDNSSLGWLGEKLTVWEVTVVYPAVFMIALADIDNHDKNRMYRLIYSFIVRRAICGLTAKNYNLIFERLTAVFQQQGVSIGVFESFLGNSVATTVRFPSDDEFRTEILRQPVYQNMGRKERIADLLWEIELATRTKYQVSGARPAGLSIEHIMPQGWRTHWPLRDGQSAPDPGQPVLDHTIADAIGLREGLLNTLGNLTLVPVPLNSQLSNGSWITKKPGLEDALLALNAELVKLENWDEAAIRSRANDLADRAIQIWPALAAAGNNGS
ncbi:DUF262 domain-containing protein [Aurantimonas litoralis]|nr:DUF262 domain-containing protein [Aurantimonas litoralis]